MAYLVDRYGHRYTDFIEFLSELRMKPATGNIIRREVKAFYDHIEELMRGEGRGLLVPEYGDIYWDVEEASLLRLSEELDDFYTEMEDMACQFLEFRNIAYDAEEILQIIQYQKMRMPRATLPTVTRWSFEYNIPEYFEYLFSRRPVQLVKKRQDMVCQPVDYKDDKVRFGRETILWGRKSGTLLVKLDPSSVFAKPSNVFEDLPEESAPKIQQFEDLPRFQDYKTQPVLDYKDV